FTKARTEHSNAEDESTAPQSPPAARSRKGAGTVQAPAEDSEEPRRPRPTRTAATARTAPAPAKAESHRAVASQESPFPVDLWALQRSITSQEKEIVELRGQVTQLKEYVKAQKQNLAAVKGKTEQASAKLRDIFIAARGWYAWRDMINAGLGISSVDPDAAQYAFGHDDDVDAFSSSPPSPYIDELASPSASEIDVDECTSALLNEFLSAPVPAPFDATNSPPSTKRKADEVEDAEAGPSKQKRLLR
ncbi:hypothetical protein FPV67DRAFT_1682553, partial [Lyophyllum atratum]